MALTPPPRLVVTEHRPHRRLLAVAAALLALVAAAGAFWLGGYLTVPEAASLREQVRTLTADKTRADRQIEQLNQRVATLERSEQGERDAARALQSTLAESNAELARLRTDVAFYERIAGGDTQRQPLAVHSLAFERLGDGSWRYRLTLTQNLKRAAISKGHYSLRIEGVQEGTLQTLDWAELLQTPAAEPGEFSFKYFQQIEGSLMLPEGFVPHRARIDIDSDQGRFEQVLPWSETQAQE